MKTWNIGYMLKSPLTLAAGAVLWTSAAFAVPITGTLSLSGSDSFTPSSITFTNPAQITGDTGSFAGLGTCLTCVTMNGFTSASTNFEVYSATNAGLMTTLTLASVTFSESNVTIGGQPFIDLTITGNGTATLTGFDPTPGSFDLTSQCSGTGTNCVPGTFSFSSTTVAAVPEPASMALFATGLVGLGALRRRRRKA